jgi:hypothetical protein
MIPFSAFEKAFLSELSSPGFGESSSDQKLLQPGSLSPGAKEIAARNLSPLLQDRDFLKSVYRLMKKQESRVKEQSRIANVPRQLRRWITMLRNAQKTLASLEKKTRQVYDKLEPRKWDVPEEFSKAIGNLSVCQDKLLNTEQHLVAMLSPAHRKPHYKASKWKVLPAPYEDELKPVRLKALDQWLVDRLNIKLAKRFKAEKAISDMTRYRTISTLVRVAGLSMMEVGAIKQHFRAQRKPPRQAARIVGNL